MNRVIKLFAFTIVYAALFGVLVESNTMAVPCGTGGTAKAPTPSPKQDKGDSKAPSTPRPNK